MRILVLLLCLQSAAVYAAPHVVTSITPLQEITASIMAGVAKPDVIIENHVSAHHFAFKPSQMRLLQQASLVIWIDNHFESSFHNLPDILPVSTQQLELMPALTITKGDGHIWYSPRRVVEIIKIIAAALMRQDPQNREFYRRNAANLITAVENWRQLTLERWQNRMPRFITDHDFLGHFARDFGIESIVSIHDSHDDTGGLKNLNHLEKRLREKPVGCLLTLESTASRLATSLAQKYQIPIISITPDIDTISNRPGILRRFDQLTAALVKCATTN